MAASLQDSGFRLPTHFLAEDEKLNGFENVCFDDGDFLARSSFHELQRIGVHCFGFEKSESTLSGIGSWLGRNSFSSHRSPNYQFQASSPPVKSVGLSDDTWELIHAAAGEVARLKMVNSCQNTRFYSQKTITTPHPQKSQLNQFVKQEDAVKQSWPTHHHHRHRHRQPVYSQNQVWNENIGCDHHRHNNPPPQIQKPTAGIGVFLPRRFSNSSENRNKPGCSPVMVPAKAVQVLNLNFNNSNEALIARRNAILMHQRRIMRPSLSPSNNHLSLEAKLPQEWTY